MPFRLTSVEAAHFPSEESTTRVLEEFGLPESAIRAAVESFVCQAQLMPGKGYQQDVAHELERHLASRLGRVPGLYSGSAKYNPRLNEQADLAIGRSGLDGRVFFELEFRPNVEKDLVKFQIGANCGTLIAAVLILASDRGTINRDYTTMPEFQKFERVVAELAPEYPLVVYGISGKHD